MDGNELSKICKVGFQIMGGMVLCFAAALFYADLVRLAGGSPHLPPQDLKGFLRSMALDVPIALLGVGLLRRTKWAAVVFSMAALYWAFSLCKDVIYPVGPVNSGDRNWITFFGAALMAIPSILTMKYWHTLPLWWKADRR